MRWARGVLMAAAGMITLGADVRLPERLQASGYRLQARWLRAEPTLAKAWFAEDTAFVAELSDASGDAVEERAAPDPKPEARSPKPRLASIAREAWVYAQPRFEARKLGYLRAGAVVGRDPEPAGFRDCHGGWFHVEPRGYVCAGSRAVLDPEDALVRLATAAPRDDLGGLPYLYALTRYPTPPVYARLPSAAQQRRIEGDIDGHLRAYAALARRPDFVAPPSADPPPDSLAAGQTLPAVGGEGRGHEQLVLETARLRSGWALLGTYDDAAGRRFGLTTDLGLVPLDRAKMVRPSAFRGVALSPELGLPVAFVRSKAARAFERLGGGPLAARRLLPWREPLVLTGRELDLDAPYLEIRDGSWVRAEQVTVVPRPNPTPPGWARRGQKWIDVSLLRQTLVAYEGLRPVYATMVSTGQGGAGDPATTHATVQGAFLIHTKHVSVTMDGDAAGDEFDLRDVPWVQYFSEGYALHGVYWHDDFGTARSHGCVNLAPLDAAWLFRWTTPEVPAGWHAALSLKHGTVVYIHP